MRFLYLLPSLFFAFMPQALALDPFRIEVVEKGSGWPVPLVELRTTSEVRLLTDNAGLIAFDLPEFMGRETWLTVTSPNYEVPANGFGYRGFRCKPEPGGRYRLEVTRTGIAKRLGRLTGSGLFAESQKLGEHLDWKESGITGSDTAMITPYKEKLFWAWGDTNLPSQALGFFNAAGATSPLHPLASYQPPLAFVYDYFRRPDGQPRGVMDLKASGPVWVTACVSLPDNQAKEHLVCYYRVVDKSMASTEVGQAEWNDTAAVFRPTTVLYRKGDAADGIPTHSNGHHAFWQDAAGKRWLYVGEGLPKLRCPATYEGWCDRNAWEKVDEPDTLPSAVGNEKIAISTGSVAWNPWRKRWVTVFQQKFGKPSVFGEVWYAEGDSPSGPWGPAIKVLSHQNYTFYNVVVHPELTPADSPVLLFEGTYTAEFADHAAPTARYNYNQILYRLDLDDPALAPTHSSR